MDGSSALGEGDASDLAWLDVRAETTSREHFEAMAEVRRRTDEAQAAIGRGEPMPGADDIPALMERLDTTLTAAVAAKTARDDAYAAQESLLEPPPQTFASPAERRAWIDLMRDEGSDALHRRDDAMAELRDLPEQAPLPADMSSEQALAIMEADEPFADRRIDLILAAEAAQKDIVRAAAALLSVETEDD